MRLTGNTVLITGGTSGIGLAFAERFLALNNTVIICGRRKERLHEIKQQHPTIITSVCDVMQPADREALAAWVTKEYPSLNVLINNAGVQLLADLTQPVDLTRIHTEIETNLVAPIHLSSLLTAHLAATTPASIINISSGLAFAPLAFMPVYCATKAAMHSLTLSQRHQLKETGVQVFEIAPPSVDTELGHDRREDKTQSHGGIPVSEFLEEAMQALEKDLLEAPIASAKRLREKGEELFELMNGGQSSRPS